MIFLVFCEVFLKSSIYGNQITKIGMVIWQNGSSLFLQFCKNKKKLLYSTLIDSIKKG